MTGHRRSAILTLAFLLAACGVEVAGPRPSATPETAPTGGPTATPRPTIASNDVVSLRSYDGPQASIIALDARTGTTLRTLRDGAVSPDRSTVFWTASTAGGTRTIVHATDLATGQELRTATVDGDLRPAPSGGFGSAETDGTHLALKNIPYQLDGLWQTKLAFLDLSSGHLDTFDLSGASTYDFLAFTPGAGAAVLEEHGGGATKLRLLDRSSRALGDPAVTGSVGLAQNGFRPPPLLSADGRWLYLLDAGTPVTNCTSTDGPRCVPNGVPPYVLALDLVSRRVATIGLPTEQRSPDFEKYLLWSLALTPDGATLYAANPALGVIDEIDAGQLALRRAGHIIVSRKDGGVLSAIGRALFPVAEAKRYVTSGALLSPDGRTLYAVAQGGLAVVDTTTLTSRGAWAPTHQFDALALSPDGARLYAIDNAKRRLVAISTRDGASLGEVVLAAYAPAIVRVEAP